MQLTAILTPASEGGYSALNPETGTAGIIRQAQLSRAEFLAAVAQ